MMYFINATDEEESDGSAIVFISEILQLPNNKTLPTSPYEQIPKSGTNTSSLEFLA